MDRVALVPADNEATFFELYAAVRGRELAMTGCTRELRDHVLAFQFDAQRRGYRDRFPGADRQLILRDGVPIGWLIVDRRDAEICCVDIALVADERRQGIGSHVLRRLQQEASTAGKPMTLTVRRANAAALVVYRRLGFRVVGETDCHARMEWRAAHDTTSEVR
jgi:ribosomal protein S18 acetylase RimI-like enzyme